MNGSRLKEGKKPKEAQVVYDSKYPQIFKDIAENVCPICKSPLIKVCKKCGVEAH